MVEHNSDHTDENNKKNNKEILDIATTTNKMRLGKEKKVLLSSQSFRNFHKIYFPLLIFKCLIGITFSSVCQAKVRNNIVITKRTD